jgi:polyhydroxybutyrate depolymerase
MIRLVGLVAVALLVLMSLPAGLAQSRSRHAVEHGGLERSYLLTLPTEPERYGGPLPLLLVLHPSGAEGAQMAELTLFDAIAERDGVAVAYPDGPGGYWDYGAGLAAWEGVPDLRDDPGFLTALLDDLSADPRIDPGRVFVAGWSNGARMAYRLACDLPERIVAIAGVASTVSDEVTGGCGPGSVSVLLIHGTADEVSPFGGKPLRIGEQVIAQALPAPDAADFWAERNGCQQSDLAIASVADDGTPSVYREERFGCDDDREVVFFTLVEGGHGWPPGLGELIWTFFARQEPLP